EPAQRLLPGSKSSSSCQPRRSPDSHPGRSECRHNREMPCSDRSSEAEDRACHDKTYSHARCLLLEWLCVIHLSTLWPSRTPFRSKESPESCNHSFLALDWLWRSLIQPHTGLEYCVHDAIA